MTSEELDRMEKLEKAATPGMWFPMWIPADPPKRHLELVGIPVGGNFLTGCTPLVIASLEVEHPHNGKVRRDMEFIAALRNAAPAMIAAARENAKLWAVVEAARIMVTRKANPDCPAWADEDAADAVVKALSALDAKENT